MLKCAEQMLIQTYKTRAYETLKTGHCIRTAESFIWRKAAVLRTHRGGSPHTEGVALMLAPEAHAALVSWEPVNSRIITAKFTTKKIDIRLNIIQRYAPTNDADEEKKDDFYQQLQAVFDRRGAKDITILMGDFNPKIGMDNTGYVDIMGTHGLGQMHENGQRFADLCALNQLVIGGSIFPHKRIHKAIWISRTTSWKTRSTTYVLAASSGDHGRMYE